jgi:hypothetical protein
VARVGGAVEVRHRPALERLGHAALRLHRTLVDESLAEAERRDVLEDLLIPAEQPDVAALEVEVRDDRFRDLGQEFDGVDG